MPCRTPPGTGNSSQSSQRDEPSRSTSGPNQVLLLRVTPPHDSDNDFEEERGKKKRYLPLVKTACNIMLYL